MTDTEATYKPDEVAERLKISYDAVMAHIHAGNLKAYDVGTGKKRGRYQVPEWAIRDFLRSRLTGQPVQQRRKRTLAKPTRYIGGW